MKVGDLVRRRANNEEYRHPDKHLGIVLSIEKRRYEDETVLVAWSNNYGSWWTRIRDLETLNECR